MISMTLPEIAAVVGGDVVHDTGAPVTGAAFVDSRATEEGGLFVAVVGEHVDGHSFATAALARGAAAVLGSRDTGHPGVVASDPVLALAALARHILGRLARTRVVALTGSQGKTSTKDLIAQVLAHAGTTVATFGSFNNEIGLPLTVLRADPATEFLVLEMGARHVGDLRASCVVAPPEVSLVLNVGKAHIGEFGSREQIAVAKGEVVEALEADGVAVLNADDPLVAAMAERTRARVLTFGADPRADVRLTDVRLDDVGRASFELAAAGVVATVDLRLVGEHHASNAAAAAAVALALGMELGAVAEALSAAVPTSRGRMEVRERADGVTVIDDAYNANPDSMRAALKTLAAIGRGRPGSRTVAVLGEMRELGDSAFTEHDAVGRLAVRLDIHQLLVVGERARTIHLGACLEGSWGGESVFVPDVEAAQAWLHDQLRAGDVVLFKASNLVALSALAQDVLGGDLVRAILLAGGLSLIFTLLGTRVAIRILVAKGYGQLIRDDGPTTHHTKRGTPTMGGLVIIVSVVLAYLAAKLLTRDAPSWSALLLLFLVVGLGTVGFLDDYIKIAKQRSLGLRSKAKIAGQTLVAVLFAVLALNRPDERGQTPASRHLSFTRDVDQITLPAIVVVLVILVIISGSSNAVNLTDGLDGLATGACTMVFGAYTLVNIWQNNQSCALTAGVKCYDVRDPLDLAAVAAALTGACFGFLWWNASPAKIFMGDTGSLSLGGALAGLAVLTRTELLLAVLGGLFVIITMSVILQVGYFKLSGGKRIFRMAPLQHHFELVGWAEITITIRFWIITGICVAAGLGVFYAEWVTGA